MYCLSSTLKHSEPAVARFSELEGWKTLNQSLQDPSQTLRTKTAFLLSQLIAQSTDPKTLLDTLRNSKTLETLLNSLSPNSALPTGLNGEVSEIDPDYRDKVLRFFVNAIERDAQGLLKVEKANIAQVVKELEDGVSGQVGDSWSGKDDLGMSEQEWSTFMQSLRSE